MEAPGPVVVVVCDSVDKHHHGQQQQQQQDKGIVSKQASKHTNPHTLRQAVTRMVHLAINHHHSA